MRTNPKGTKFIKRATEKSQETARSPIPPNRIQICAKGRRDHHSPRVIRAQIRKAHLGSFSFPPPLSAVRKLPIPTPRRFSGRTGGLCGTGRLGMDHWTLGPNGRRRLSRRLGYRAPTRGRGGGGNRQRSAGTFICQGQLRIRLIRRIRGTQGRRIQYWE